MHIPTWCRLCNLLCFTRVCFWTPLCFLLFSRNFVLKYVFIAPDHENYKDKFSFPTVLNFHINLLYGILSFLGNWELHVHVSYKLANFVANNTIKLQTLKRIVLDIGANKVHNFKYSVIRRIYRLKQSWIVLFNLWKSHTANFETRVCSFAGTTV